MRHWIFWHRDSTVTASLGALAALSDFSAHMSHRNVRLARSCDSQKCLWSVHNLRECCGDFFLRTSSPSACRQEWGARHVRSVSAPWGRQQAGGGNLSGNRFLRRHFVPFIGWAADLIWHAPSYAVHSPSRGLRRCSLTSPKCPRPRCLVTLSHPHLGTVWSSQSVWHARLRPVRGTWREADTGNPHSRCPTPLARCCCWCILNLLVRFRVRCALCVFLACECLLVSHRPRHGGEDDCAERWYSWAPLSPSCPSLLLSCRALCRPSSSCFLLCDPAARVSFSPVLLLMFALFGAVLLPLPPFSFSPHVHVSLSSGRRESWVCQWRRH